MKKVSIILICIIICLIFILNVSATIIFDKEENKKLTRETKTTLSNIAIESQILSDYKHILYYPKDILQNTVINLKSSS